MSYTTFEYKNLEVSSETFQDVDGLVVSVDVTNTGKMPGKEVVQVYVQDHQSKLVRPPKELKGFTKVELQPGETRTVTVELDFRAFAYYHPAYRQWITEEGEFDILAGASSTDIRLKKTVMLICNPDLPCILNRESTLREWVEDPRGLSVLASLYQQMDDQMQTAFAGNDGEQTGLDPMGFLMDMPLTGLLHFLRGTITDSPEEMVDDLLDKVHNKG
jgi:beta-glucosidase